MTDKVGPPDRQTRYLAASIIILVAEEMSFLPEGAGPFSSAAADRSGFLGREGRTLCSKAGKDQT
jgi:hypothetical protein